MKSFILLLALFFTVNASEAMIEANPEKTPEKELTTAQQVHLQQSEYPS